MKPFNFLLLKGLGQIVLGSILTYIQLQGHFKYKIFEKYESLAIFLGIPISAFFLWSVKNLVPAFDGEMWPSRLLSFAVSIVVFTIMTKCWFDEPVSLKTGVCLILSVCIVLVQLFWK